MTDLKNITDDQREALRIVEALTTTIALPTLYPRAAAMAADYIESVRFTTDDDDRKIIAAFAKYLREQASND